MNKTSIEWVRNADGSQGYSWNTITGCLNHDNGLCKGGAFPCYAHRLAHGRLKNVYGINSNIAPVHAEGGEEYHQSDKDIAAIEPFYPRLWPNRLDAASGVMPKAFYKGKWAYPGKSVFVCDMGDLFGIGIPEEWTRQIIAAIAEYPADRFYLLTKQPQRLANFSPFPDNCCIGVSACTYAGAIRAFKYLFEIQAKIKYISFEPLLEDIAGFPPAGLPCEWERINWFIIGACTSNDHWELDAYNYHHDTKLQLMKWGNRWTLQPSIEWVRGIAEAADLAGIPIFLKDNLYPLIHKDTTVSDRGRLRVGTSGNLRQELPQ